MSTTCKKNKLVIPVVDNLRVSSSEIVSEVRLRTDIVNDLI